MFLKTKSLVLCKQCSFERKKHDIDLFDKSVCDIFCMCCGVYANWLYVFHPCNIIYFGIRKNTFMESCDKSDNNLKSYSLFRTIELY
jgi:hypothetical protein